MESQEEHHHHQHGESALAELVDLDAEVLHEYLSDLTGWIGELTADGPPHRILDLGSGTGTGTFALLARFGDAEATAVDLSPDMLQRVTDKARGLGLTGRVRTLQADLDAGWPVTGPVDLVWASASLHHMADPVRVLTEVRAALAPDGLLIITEIEGFPRFLPDDIGLGRPGLETRCQEALDEVRTAALPHLGADWGSYLSQAGLTIEAERAFRIELTPPLPAATGRYAVATLQRIRSGLEDKLGADDLATLDTLLHSPGPDGIARRDDLTVRTTRTVWAARP
jgi:SAM-dependent methyltransferase